MLTFKQDVELLDLIENQARYFSSSLLERMSVEKNVGLKYRVHDKREQEQIVHKSKWWTTDRNLKKSERVSELEYQNTVEQPSQGNIYEWRASNIISKKRDERRKIWLRNGEEERQEFCYRLKGKVFYKLGYNRHKWIKNSKLQQISTSELFEYHVDCSSPKREFDCCFMGDFEYEGSNIGNKEADYEDYFECIQGEDTYRLECLCFLR